MANTEWNHAQNQQQLHLDHGALTRPEDSFLFVFAISFDHTCERNAYCLWLTNLGVGGTHNADERQDLLTRMVLEPIDRERPSLCGGNGVLQVAPRRLNAEARSYDTN